MSYTIEQEAHSREPFAEYRYCIFKDGQLVAHYRHDYRGDDHSIVLVGGKSVDWPVGHMVEFLQGGGPEPLSLTARAVAFLDALGPHAA